MNLKENFLFIIFCLVILALSYFWYTNWRVPSADVESYSQSDIFGVEFLSMAARMKRIQLKADFLQSEAFLALKDLTPVIQVPAITGRRNPFLPIGPTAGTLFPEGTPIVEPF